MAKLLYRLGRFAARRHWIVILSWVAIILLSGAGFALLSSSTTSSITIPGTATSTVTDELARKFPQASGGSGVLVFESTDGKPFTETHKSAISSFLRDLNGLSGVKDTIDPFETQAQVADRGQQLDDGRTQIADAREQLSDAKAALESGQEQLNSGQAQLDAGQAQLDAAKAQAEAAGQLEATRVQFAATQAQIDSEKAVIDAQKKQLDAGLQEITDSTKTLTAQELKLTLGAQLLDLSRNMRFVSADGTAAVGTVQFTKSTTELTPALKSKIVDAAETASIPNVKVSVSSDIAEGVPSVLGVGEIIGLIVAAIVLLLMLRTVIGAGLPLVSALVGVVTATLGALSFSKIVDFTSVTPILGVMLGLAVGIDYTLFIVNRHRTQLKQGMSVHESIGLANGTSGNAVVFAGTTVIVALLALNITGVPFLGTMGTVGAVGIAVAILVAITLTPAMLSLVKMRILSRKERAAIGNTAPQRAAAKPMGNWRAVVTLIAGVAVLGIMALPAMHMRLGLPVGSSEATSSSQYSAYKTVAEKFGEGQNGPLLVIADLPEKATEEGLLAQQAAIATKIAAQEHVAAVAPIGVSSDSTVVAFEVIPTGGPASQSTETLVHDLRNLSPIASDVGDIRLGIAGNASAQIDISEKLAAVLPLYLLVVVGLSLIILIIVFRSILVPITATAGFVLSLLATFGGLTAIYQWGWLSAIFGVHDPAPILSFLPVIEVGILFGLAMDYQLFLVSGMREAYAHGAPARVAVMRGLQVGRPVVTAAAIIMISVFSGFVFSESSTIRPIGFGLAFGVLADAFIVRMLLIPAAMHLLGKAAWWMPKWLDRIVPDVDVEGASLERVHPVAAPAPEVPAEPAAVRV